MAYTDNASILLANGSAMSFNYDQTCSGPQISGSNTCGTIIVDTNGYSQPNKWGNDVYGLWILPNTVKPFGSSDDTTYVTSSCNSNGQGCAYPYIYDITPPFSSLGGTCDTDSSIGQSCTDNEGVSAFYAGTCTPENISNVSGYGDASSGWEQYYNADGTTNPSSSFNGANSSADTINCGAGKNLYVSPTEPSVSYCQSLGAVDCDVNNFASDCYYSTSVNGSTSTNTCYLNFQDAINYCTNLGSGWRVPSEDELIALDANNNQYGSNQFSTDDFTSSTEGNNHFKWTVYVESGTAHLTLYTNASAVRCIRSSN